MSTLTPSLVADIRREIDAADTKAIEAIHHARRAGEMLSQAKAELQHGEWLPWLASNFNLSSRTAQNYMRLAARWESLPIAQHDAHLSMREALASIAGRAVAPSIIERLKALAYELGEDESGEDELIERMALLKADAFAALESMDIPTCTQLIQAAGMVEIAAAERRIRAAQMLGGMLSEAAI